MKLCENCQKGSGTKCVKTLFNKVHVKGNGKICLLFSPKTERLLANSSRHLGLGMENLFYAGPKRSFNFDF